MVGPLPLGVRGIGISPKHFGRFEHDSGLTAGERIIWVAAAWATRAAKTSRDFDMASVEDKYRNDKSVE